MSLIAKFRLPVTDFVMGDVLQRDEVERIEFVCRLRSRAAIMPFFWVRGGQSDRIGTLLERDSSIESVSLIDELEETQLYRVSWQSQIPFLVAVSRRSNSVIRSVTGDSVWEIELSFDRRADLKTFTHYYEDTGMDLQLEQVYSLCRERVAHEELTPPQRETLITAEKEGFYDEPREVTMEELAAELDISLAAVSGRLRRGTSNLVRNTLL